MSLTAFFCAFVGGGIIGGACAARRYEWIIMGATLIIIALAV